MYSLHDALPISCKEYMIKEAIEGGTLVAVTDGSYIKERYPHLCSAAFILECSKGSGWVFGSFPECSQGANAYRGELMGLLAIHLILLAAKKSLAESMRTYSDIFRLPGGDRESSKSTAASHSNKVSALGHIEEYFGWPWCQIRIHHAKK